MELPPGRRPQLAAAQARGAGALEATLHAQLRSSSTATAPAAAPRSWPPGLGFDSRGPVERPVREFSGGLRMRANLARALMRQLGPAAAG